MHDGFITLLSRGLRQLSVDLSPQGLEQCWSLTEALLKWNEKVNLTAITAVPEVVEKHFLDSLAVVSEVRGVQQLLDLGAGAGFPGLPLLIAMPNLRATLVDAVSKKVSFMKTGAVKAGVASRATVVHRKALGQPDAEQLPRVDGVISRAFMEPSAFLQLAKAYLVPDGKAVVMVGQDPGAGALQAWAKDSGLELVSWRAYALPFSGDPRGVAVFRCST